MTQNQLKTPDHSKKLAIIGSGISGLGAASVLHASHHVTLYEANPTLGGHSRTVEVPTQDGSIAVDTGFIVFNKRNYPLLTRLFEFHHIPIAPSDMSFGVSIDHGWLEYGTRHALGLFAQKRNLLRVQFWKMIFDILKFNQTARRFLHSDPSISLGDCLHHLGMGSWFRNYYLLAMGGAIWSMPLNQMLDFPAHSFLRFFDNHGLLTVADHPQWYTVVGGSRSYVARLGETYCDQIYLGRAAQKIWRADGHVCVQDQTGATHVYDDVVLACHADQARAIIADPTPQEDHVLTAFRYQKNTAILHSDVSFMPSRPSAWASWVYLSDQQSHTAPQVSLSYWMNNLQPLKTKTPLFVTLNPGRMPDPATVYDMHEFEHPVFDENAIRMQDQIETIQGQNRLWFCGAYQRYGFHEDGLLSAVQMAKKMGYAPIW